MLGQFSLQRQDKIIHRFRTRKAAGLLAYLACFPQRRHAREELTEMLWPDALPEAARQNFRQALSTLRACLEPDVSQRGLVLVSDGLQITLSNLAVTTDTGDFQNAVQRAESETCPHKRATHLADAATLYGGELLPGIYEDWILRERERLRVLYMGVLEPLWQYEEARQNWTAALDYALRGMESDACHEAAHLAAIRCYFEIGQAARAQECYDGYTRRVQQELGIIPSSALRALIQSRQHSSALSDTTQSAAAPRHSASNANVSLHREAALSIVANQEVASKTPSMYVPAPKSDSPVPDLPRLPLSLTTFFGRDAEIQRIRFLLAPPTAPALVEDQQSKSRAKIENTVRLLTLIGPGGCGKTRLAVEAGRTLRADFHDAVYYVALADVPHAAHIASSVADALCRTRSGAVGPSVSCDPMERIAACLASYPALLILDNYEHLVEDGAGFVSELLQCCPLLTCLVTSRHRLNVSGERTLPLRPLSVPDPNGGIEALRDNAAVQLFIDRAQATRPDFRLTPHNAAHIAAVCAGLEGLPLALELAAARIGTFSLTEMRRQIEHEDGGLRLLVSRHRDTHHRHHNLHATIAWSFCLLSERAQEFFTRLSLLHGTWTADAAQAVTNDADTAETLEDLCQASLVIPVEIKDAAEGEDAPARFRLLEMLRQFGAKRLTGRARVEAEHRHAVHYLKQAQNYAPGNGVTDSMWLARMQQDLSNLRVNLEWCFSTSGDEAIGIDLCLALESFWRRRGLFQEAQQYLRRALAASALDADLTRKAAILHAAARFASLLGENAQATDWGSECVRLQRGLADERLLAQALYRLGHYLWVDHNLPDSEAAHREALALYERLDDPQGMGNVLNSLGTLAMTRGDLEAAGRCWTRNLALSRAARDDIGTGSALCNLSFLAIDAEDWHGALRLIHESIPLFERAGDIHWTASGHGMAAWIQDSTGDSDSAEHHYQLALAGFENKGDQSRVAQLWLARARAALHRHDNTAAKQWLHRSVEILLPATQRNDAWDGLAVWVYEFAIAAYGEGHAALGVRLQSFAQAVYERMSERPLSSIQKRLDYLAGLAHAALGEEVYTRCQREGQALSWQEAIGLALSF